MGDFEPQVPASEPVGEPTPEEIAASEEQYRRRVAGYIQLLKDKNLTFRWRAAEALGDLHDPGAVEPLIEALRDPFIDVQWLAAKSLGKIGDLRAVDPLIAVLKSEAKWLRQGAAWGRREAGYPRRPGSLWSSLNDPGGLTGTRAPKREIMRVAPLGAPRKGSGGRRAPRRGAGLGPGRSLGAEGSGTAQVPAASGCQAPVQARAGAKASTPQKSASGVLFRFH